MCVRGIFLSWTLLRRRHSKPNHKQRATNKLDLFIRLTTTHDNRTPKLPSAAVPAAVVGRSRPRTRMRMRISWLQSKRRQPRLKPLIQNPISSYFFVAFPSMNGSQLVPSIDTSNLHAVTGGRQNLDGQLLLDFLSAIGRRARPYPGVAGHRALRCFTAPLAIEGIIRIRSFVDVVPHDRDLLAITPNLRRPLEIPAGHHKKSPGIHSAVSVELNFPPAPQGPCATGPVGSPGADKVVKLLHLRPRLRRSHLRPRRTCK